MTVLVLGRARSGTSLVTAILVELGLSAGNEPLLKAGDAGNPSGYFEYESLLAFNRERVYPFLRQQFGVQTLFPLGWQRTPGANELIDEGRSLLNSLIPDRDSVLKDPEIAVLLPFWSEVLAGDYDAVVVYRDPREVAASSIKFGLIPRWNAPMLAIPLASWIVDSCELIGRLEGRRMHLLSYNRLLESPESVIETLAESLRAWGRTVTHEQVLRATALVNPSYYRSKSTRVRLTILPLPRTQAYATSFAALEGGHEATSPRTVPPPPTRYVRSLVALRKALVPLEAILRESAHRRHQKAVRQLEVGP